MTTLRRCCAYLVPSLVVWWLLLQVFWMARTNTSASSSSSSASSLFTINLARGAPFSSASASSSSSSLDSSSSTTLTTRANNPGESARRAGSRSLSSLLPANSTTSGQAPSLRIPAPLTARLIYEGKYNRSGGLWMDVVIYRDLLEGLGYAVEIVNTREHATPKSAAAGVADIQVLFERLHHPWLVAGRYNMFVINHEIKHEIRLYRLLDAIVCKSMMAKKLVDRHLRNYARRRAPLDLDVFYVGHTSADPREKLASLPAVKQDFTQFIHVGGKSLNKGSDVVYETWRKHPEWPTLHLVDFKHSERYFRAEHVCTDCAYNSWPNRTGVMIQQNLIIYTERLADEELLRLQQSSGVHLCPSREEGFGHYINEARALGALVMTTNWAPMNDMVQDHFGVLIPCQLTSTSLYQSSLPGNQACRVGPTDLEKAMQKYFGLVSKKAKNENDNNNNINDDKNEIDDQLSLDKVRSMGEFARVRYEDDRDDFRDRMHNLFGKVLPQMMLTHQNVHKDDINVEQ